MWFQKNTEVICVGSASQDIFFPTDEGVILETPEDITAKQKIAFELGGKYRVEDRYEAIGGVAANVACGLARLGRSVAAYSCIGGDEMGRFILRELARLKVATHLVHTFPDAKTDLSAIIVVPSTGERTIFHNRDANERLIVESAKLKDTKWLFVSALNGDWRTNLATLFEAKQPYGLSIAYNPGQHNIREDAKRIFSVLPNVDVLLLNKDEAIELLMQQPVRPSDDELNDEAYLLRALNRLGVGVIGMTDGKRGAWASDGQEMWHCPIYTRTAVVDSTGAGDAFGSGFFASYLAGQTLDQALVSGIANSGSVVGAYGAIEGLLDMPLRDELVTHIVAERLS